MIENGPSYHINPISSEGEKQGFETFRLEFLRNSPTSNLEEIYVAFQNFKKGIRPSQEKSRLAGTLSVALAAVSSENTHEKANYSVLNEFNEAIKLEKAKNLISQEMGSEKKEFIKIIEADFNAFYQLKDKTKNQFVIEFIDVHLQQLLNTLQQGEALKYQTSIFIKYRDVQVIKLVYDKYSGFKTPILRKKLRGNGLIELINGKWPEDSTNSVMTPSNREKYSEFVNWLKTGENRSSRIEQNSQLKLIDSTYEIDPATEKKVKKIKEKFSKEYDALKKLFESDIVKKRLLENKKIELELLEASLSRTSRIDIRDLIIEVMEIYYKNIKKGEIVFSTPRVQLIKEKTLELFNDFKGNRSFNNSVTNTLTKRGLVRLLVEKWPFENAGHSLKAEYIPVYIEFINWLKGENPAQDLN